MIGDSHVMQLNAASILIAAQQAPRQTPTVQPGAASFASAMSPGSDDLFAPLQFKQAAAPAAPARPQAPMARIGSTLDIRV